MARAQSQASLHIQGQERQYSVFKKSTTSLYGIFGSTLEWTPFPKISLSISLYGI